jgi:hypothetical protein
MNHTQLATKLITLLIPFCVACGGGDDDPGGTAGTSGSGGGGGSGGSGSGNPYSGKTYLLDMRDRYWNEPRGAVLEFAPYVRGFILEVSGDSTSSYNVKAGTLELNVDGEDPPPAPVQDLCSPTGMLTASGVKIGPDDFKMNIRHLSEDLNAHATVRELTFDNIYPSGMDLRLGEFSATLDARDIAHLFTQLVGAGMTPTPEMLCDALETEISPPAPCAPCAHDGVAMCLTLTANNFEAVETTIALQDVTEATAMSAACQGGLSN